jgi:hypothetical protein
MFVQGIMPVRLVGFSVCGPITVSISGELQAISLSTPTLAKHHGR